MEIAHGAGFVGLRCSELSSSSYLAPPARGGFPFHQSGYVSRRCLSVSVSRSSLPESEFSGEEVMRMFLKDRQLNGDFISRASDMIWRKEKPGLADEGTSTLQDVKQPCNDVVESDSNGGFLKLTSTRDWISSERIAPVNKKREAKNWLKESEQRKKINLLKYEALKRELLFLTIGVGAACSAYCLVIFSFQASLSYASGVLFSCLYLQLLYYHTENLSKEAIPEIFLRKKTKKIGIRSEDIKDSMEKILGGTSFALSSPRLVIPSAIFGLWALSRHFPNDYFDFQLVPAMFGFFAYKAAALIQVYRDNEELRLILPDDDTEKS